MHLNIPPNLTNDLKKLANEVNIPAERLAQLFVEDGVKAYLYTHDGPNALRENLGEADA
jgi:hypothetical protein